MRPLKLCFWRPHNTYVNTDKRSALDVVRKIVRVRPSIRPSFILLFFFFLHFVVLFCAPCMRAVQSGRGDRGFAASRQAARLTTHKNTKSTPHAPVQTVETTCAHVTPKNKRKSMIWQVHSEGSERMDRHRVTIDMSKGGGGHEAGGGGGMIAATKYVGICYSGHAY